MRRRLLLSFAIFALLGAACSPSPETVVAGAGEPTSVDTTVPGERPADQSTTLIGEGNAQRPEQDPPILQPLDEPTTTLGSETAQEPDPIPTGDEPPRSWRDRPLARVVLTGDDLSVLGLDFGWEVDWIDFIEIDDPSQFEDQICGKAAPQQRSYFVASFEERSVGMELEVNVMPATSDATAASDFLTALEVLVTCPDLEEQYESISMEIVAVDVAGADESIVITGTDATALVEPIGVTLAAAEVDGHLFMAFVSRASGIPGSGDTALAVRAIELSISRL